MSALPTPYHILDFLMVPQDCGAQNCIWFVHGRYDGSYRELGSMLAVIETTDDVRVVARPPSSWPVIATGSHYSAFEGGVTFWQLVSGRYVPIDSYLGCADIGNASGRAEGSALIHLAPPFDACQYD